MQIAESFRRFGVQDTTTSLIAIKVVTVPQSTSEEQAAIANISQHLQTHVQGQQMSFTDVTLAEVSDVDRIRKVYKAPLPPTPKGGKAQSNGTAASPSQIHDLEAILLGSMAIKGS
jgi:EKC/KEOPS complex subunit CGI121/TPRKB